MKTLNQKLESITTTQANEIVQYVGDMMRATGTIPKQTASATASSKSDTNLNRRLNELEKDLDSLKRKYNIKKDENEKLSYDNDRLNNLLGTLKRKTNDLTNIKEENEELNAEVDRLNGLRLKLLRKIYELEDEREEQQREIEDLETQLTLRTEKRDGRGRSELNTSRHEEDERNDSYERRRSRLHIMSRNNDFEEHDDYDRNDSYDRRRSRFHTSRNDDFDFERESFGIRDILRMIPKYSGKREELRIYINKCDELWSYVRSGSHQAKFVPALKNNLFDEAALLLLDEENMDTWEDVKELLKKNFGTDPNHSNNLALLEGMKQIPGESLRK